MNKYIFLDIDGVLNSAEYYLEKPVNVRIKELEGTVPDTHIAVCLASIDSSKVKLLNKLIDETKARIVISSSWRGDSALQYVFSKAGIEGLIYGETPRLPNESRGKEVRKWLETERWPYRYVIIDDDMDMLDSQLDHFVQTDWKVGLTEENVIKAIKILNDD